MVIAIVGAGGKTGLIKKLAKEYKQQGKRVFITTSTHMWIEEDTLLTDDAEEIIENLKKKNYAFAGVEEGKKIKALSLQTYEKVCKHAEIVLVEADGSKHLPLKFPGEKEPVIPGNVDQIIVVFGLHGLGKPVKEVVHRWEAAKEFFDKFLMEEEALSWEEDTLVTWKHIEMLLQKGYLEKLKKTYPDKSIVLYPSHPVGLYQRVAKRLCTEKEMLSLVKEAWFRPQPKLIICGGGHVSTELVKMASCLDFTIKVIDDREEFANKQRFPLAEEVICDSFQNLDSYLEPEAYYIVVTRGHKDDFVCVKKILKTNYSYLGMIGSRLKVAKQMENLEKEGFSKEQLGTIFAPIGLNINAITPAEIAISILAQIIQEKNKHHVASASKQLLECEKEGVLCIIVEKRGSSPRGVGSMMMVTKDEVIDSIGGGAVEFAAIEDARNCKEIMVKEYQLNNRDSEKLGMICGGTNKVLFVPI